MNAGRTGKGASTTTRKSKSISIPVLRVGRAKNGLNLLALFSSKLFKEGFQSTLK